MDKKSITKYIIIYGCSILTIFGLCFWNKTNILFDTFGNFTSGLFGSVFGFITVVLLIMFEAKRREESNKRNDTDEINNAIKQNREIFNSITAYEQYDCGKITEPFNSDIRTAQFSGPETFWKLNQYFFKEYKIVARQLYQTPEFIDALSDISANALLNHCKITWENRSNGEVLTYRGKPQEQLKEYSKGLILFEIIDKCNIETSDFEEMLLEDYSNNTDPDKVVALILNAFERFYVKHIYLYGHYIRNQYYVFETIENCKTLSASEKEYYFKLYRSHLSAYELVIMFYNALSKMSMLSEKSESKNSYCKYIKRYEMLDDLDKIHFIHAKLFEKTRYSLLKD